VANKTLSAILEGLDGLDDELTISAGEPWTVSSSAVAVPEPGASTPRGKENLSYLLEVGLAKEVVQVWRQWRGGREPTLPDKIEAVLYYATHDSYLPT
jgi:hypothetical protein